MQRSFKVEAVCSENQIELFAPLDNFVDKFPKNWVCIEFRIGDPFCDGFKENSRSLEDFVIKVSKTKRRTYLKNFACGYVDIQWIYRMQNQLLRGLCLLWKNVAQKR